MRIDNPRLPSKTSRYGPSRDLIRGRSGALIFALCRIQCRRPRCGARAWRVGRRRLCTWQRQGATSDVGVRSHGANFLTPILRGPLVLCMILGPRLEAPWGARYISLVISPDLLLFSAQSLDLPALVCHLSLPQCAARSWMRSWPCAISPRRIAAGRAHRPGGAQNPKPQTLNPYRSWTSSSLRWSACYPLAGRTSPRSPRTRGAREVGRPSGRICHLRWLPPHSPRLRALC